MGCLFLIPPEVSTYFYRREVLTNWVVAASAHASTPAADAVIVVNIEPIENNVGGVVQRRCRGGKRGYSTGPASSSTFFYDKVNDLSFVRQICKHRAKYCGIRRNKLTSVDQSLGSRGG